MTKKVMLKLHTYDIVRDAVEQGLGFAINRLEDCGWHSDAPDTGAYERRRVEALERMTIEVMSSLSDVVAWEE